MATAADDTKEETMKSKSKETHNLQVKLSRDEVLLRGTQLASTVNAIAEKEATAKAVASDFKIDIDKAKKQASALAFAVETGRELQPVICSWDVEQRSSADINDDRLTRVYRVWCLRRDDTGEVVNEQPVTAADLQEDLPLGN